MVIADAEHAGVDEVEPPVDPPSVLPPVLPPVFPPIPARLVSVLS